MIIFTLLCFLIAIIYAVIMAVVALIATVFSLITAPFIAISQFIDEHKKDN